MDGRVGADRKDGTSVAASTADWSGKKVRRIVFRANPAADRQLMTHVSGEESKTANSNRPAAVSLGALSGLPAGFAALTVAELVAAGVRPQGGPVVEVGVPPSTAHRPR